MCWPMLIFGQVQIGDDIDGEGSGDQSGESVSISGDGSIIAIGAIFNNGSGLDSGHVRVYENVGGNWEQLGQDIDGEVGGDLSGESVSLSSDGSRVAIGAPSNNGNGDNSGHVRVFENIAGSWVQVGQDIDGESLGDLSGFNVVLSADGNTVASGGHFNSDNGSLSGQVRVFEFINGSWEQLGQDINGQQGEQLSRGISFSADASVIAIGAPGNNPSGGLSYVKVYENISGNWVQQGQTLFGESGGDEFGFKVSLSADGTVLAVAAPGNNGNGSNSGQVRVFENIGGSWEQIGDDIDGEATGDELGWSVNISSEGDIVAVGAPFNIDAGVDSGHVRVYQNVGGNWQQLGVDIDGEAMEDRSGASTSLSADGRTLAVGAYRNNGGGTDSGHVRMYDLSGLLTSKSIEFFNFQLYPNPTVTSFTIELAKGVELKEVKIYNQLGQVVLTKSKENIEVSTLPAAVYLVEVTTSQGKGVKKLQIQ